MLFPTFSLKIPRVQLTVFKGFKEPAKDSQGKQAIFGKKVGKGICKSKQLNTH